MANLVATQDLELINEHLKRLQLNPTNDARTHEVFQKDGIDIQKVRERVEGLIAEDKKFIETLKKQKNERIIE